MSAYSRLGLDHATLAEFCQRRQIRKLSLFGSVIRADFGPESDIDVLVEFEPEVRVGLWMLAGLRGDLVDLFGREVDVATPDMLSKYIRKRVLDSAQTIYVR